MPFISTHAIFNIRRARLIQSPVDKLPPTTESYTDYHPCTFKLKGMGFYVTPLRVIWRVYMHDAQGRSAYIPARSRIISDL